MSDAQSVVLQGNMRRAVLEMAIACEIAAMQALFSPSTQFGAAYGHLAGKGKVNVKVIDLIDSAAKTVLKRSFKEDEKIHYDNIDHIFRCRNQAAHKGKLTYKDKGVEHSVDKSTLSVWWDSALILLE
jgi:hypothetical protein